MNYLKRAVIIVIIFLIGICCLVVFDIGTYHQRQLNELSEQLNSFALPPNSTLINTNEAYGKFILGLGNGGYMDIISSITFETDLSKKEILEYYRSVNIYRTADNPELKADVEVYFQDSMKWNEDSVDSYYTSIDNQLLSIADYDEMEKLDLDEDAVMVVIQTWYEYSYYFQID